MHEVGEVWVSVLGDGFLELGGGDITVLVGVDGVEGVLDDLLPALVEGHVELVGHGFEGMEDLVELPGTVVVGVDGVEDGGLDLVWGDLAVGVGVDVVEDVLHVGSGWWGAVVLGSAVLVDHVHDLVHGEGTVTVGIDGLEHLVEWHLGGDGTVGLDKLDFLWLEVGAELDGGG